MTSVRPNLKPDVPKVLTAWDTKTGRTVYRTAAGQWSASLTDAEILVGDASDPAMEQAKTEEHLVFDPYFMEVSDDLRPAGRETLRETIRFHGPSHRNDVGRQAQNT